MKKFIKRIIDRIRRKPLLVKPVVNGSLSFKEQMKQDIIPRVWKMAEKEKEHLNWLIDNNAPKEMIEKVSSISAILDKGIRNILNMRMVFKITANDWVYEKVCLDKLSN